MKLIWSISVALPIVFAVEAHLAKRHIRRCSALKNLVTKISIRQT